MSSKQSACAYPWQQMNIDLTGEVVPCCFWSGYGNSGKALGNTNTQSLEEIWNGEAYRDLRQRNASGDLEGHPCHKCIAWQWAGESYPGFTWPAEINLDSGYCWQLVVPGVYMQRVEELGQPVVLTEDGATLPEPDDMHDTIRQQGEGRYSLWAGTLFFSSTDGSDPRSNGRSYELRCGDATYELPRLHVDTESGKNLIQANEDFEAGTEVMQAKPSLLSFISTADCNIDCPACSQNTVRLVKVAHRQSTEDQVVALVPYLKQLIWHGGEPYLIKGLRAFIDSYDREHNPNFTFGFTSNGTLLNAEELEKLMKFPAINASISVDSFQRDTFSVIRAGANFDTVITNLLRAMERYSAPEFVLSVGMIITKLNLVELPENLEFAMEHGIGMNLSPVVVYPVSERLDVFTNFHEQTQGWSDALDRAAAIIERARQEGRAAIRRIDPTGMVAALRQILDHASERHADMFDLTIELADPTESLTGMRDPGLIVCRTGEQSQPLAYARFDRGPGTYVLQLPSTELREVDDLYWDFVHDVLEPMGALKHERNWAPFPNLLQMEVPEFRGLVRPRNPLVANFGRATADALHVVEPTDIFDAYEALVQRELAEGLGRVSPAAAS
jgi:radical SAM protein with 4Fe4S-binding SPASM domain